MRKFFVYGTLIKGMSNHLIIPTNSIEKIEEATINNMDLYSYISGGFPCMIPGAGYVKGEVITIKEKYLGQCLFLLDRLEGYDEGKSKKYNFYNREIKEVVLGNGESTSAFTYIFNYEFDKRGLGAPIKEGDFKLWKTQFQLED